MATTKASAGTSATAKSSKSAAGKPSTRKASTTGASKTKTARALDGRTAQVRHFLVDTSVFQAAKERATEEGFSMAEVSRAGVAKYAEDGRSGPSDRDKASTRLDAVTEDLKDLWATKDSDKVNAYLAALHRDGGWPLAALADLLVRSGAVSRISRQAVQLRVKKAPDEAPEGLPPVPASGHRRRPGNVGDLYDYSFYIDDETYLAAQEWATYSGAQMSSVVEDVLRRYAAGDLRVQVVPEDDEGETSPGVEAPTQD